MKKLSLFLSCALLTACTGTLSSENSRQSANTATASELAKTAQAGQVQCSRSNYRTVKKREACRAKIRQELLARSMMNGGK